MEWLLRFLPLLDENTGENGGGGDDGGNGGNGSNGANQSGLTDQQLETALSNFLSNRNVSAQGDANAAAMAVFREFYPDNYELRQERNTLKTQLEGLQGKALSDEDAAFFAGVKELGLDLEGLNTLKANADTYAQAQRELTVNRIAQAGGYDADVLGTLLNGREPVLSENADPKKLESYTLEVNGENKPLKDWVETDNAKFLPSLVADGKPAAPKAPAGSGAAGGGTDYVSSYLNRRQGKTNQ